VFYYVIILSKPAFSAIHIFNGTWNVCSKTKQEFIFGLSIPSWGCPYPKRKKVFYGKIS